MKFTEEKLRVHSFAPGRSGLRRASKIPYFFRLEKQRSNHNTLNIDGMITSDSKLIFNFCSMFYSKLYTSNYSEHLTSSFFSSLKDSKNILTEDKIFCDKPITIKEILDSINHLKNNKSPGTDGLISEFYKSFAQKMAPFLLHVFNESI